MTLKLKNLVFSEPTTILPATIDDHQDWQQHLRLRDTVATTLTAASDELGRCRRARAQFDQGLQEVAVQQLLEGDPAAMRDLDARIIAADAAILTAQTRVATAAESLKRLDARGVELWNVIVCALRGPVEAARRDVGRKLAKTLREAQV